jgi:hypothetical protein
MWQADPYAAPEICDDRRLRYWHFFVEKPVPPVIDVRS